jgi:hypothetical protein
MPVFLRWIGGVAIGSFFWWWCVITYDHDDDITRTIFGTGVALLFSTVMLVVGLPLRMAWIAGVWWRIRYWLLGAAGIGALIILFSNSLGLTHSEFDPDVDRTIDEFNWPWLPYLSYGVVVWAVVNWPRKP